MADKQNTVESVATEVGLLRVIQEYRPCTINVLAAWKQERACTACHIAITRHCKLKYH